jgi:hypothetical protein
MPRYLITNDHIIVGATFNESVAIARRVSKIIYKEDQDILLESLIQMTWCDLLFGEIRDNTVLIERIFNDVSLHPKEAVRRLGYWANFYVICLLNDSPYTSVVEQKWRELEQYFHDDDFFPTDRANLCQTINSLEDFTGKHADALEWQKRRLKIIVEYFSRTYSFSTLYAGTSAAQLDPWYNLAHELIRNSIYAMHEGKFALVPFVVYLYRIARSQGLKLNQFLKSNLEWIDKQLYREKSEEAISFSKVKCRTKKSSIPTLQVELPVKGVGELMVDLYDFVDITSGLSSNILLLLNEIKRERRKHFLQLLSQPNSEIELILRLSSGLYISDEQKAMILRRAELSLEQLKIKVPKINARLSLVIKKKFSLK